MYELCCDMIDLLINMSEIYGQPNGNSALRTTDEEDEDEECLNEDREHFHEDDNEHHEWNLEGQNEYGDDENVHINGVRNNSYLNSKSSARISATFMTIVFLAGPLGTTPVTNHQHSLLIETTSEPASAVFDSMSSSVIKLTGGRALYLKEVNRHLALICILREEALTKQALIDYNVRQLKKSIIKLFRLNHQINRPTVTSSNFVQ